MKFSFLCSLVYLDPALHGVAKGWPRTRGEYLSDTGEYSTDFALHQCEVAEELGFDMVSTSEHHYSPHLPTPQAAVLLAAIAQRTKRVRLGWMGPLVAMNNPIRIAEETAMLDQMSHGRLSVLYLRGTPNEFLAYGVNPEETRGRTQEAVQLILKCLTETQPFSWEGRYFRHRTISVWPGVTQKPYPPVFSSGNSPASVEFAAKNHFGLALSFYPAPLAKKLIDQYKSDCERYGWTPTPEDIMYRGYVACGETQAEAEHLNANFWGARVEARGGGNRGSAIAKVDEGRLQDDNPTPTEIGTDADGKAIADSSGKAAGFALGRLAFWGTPDAMVKQMTDFCEETGVGYIDLGFNGGGFTGEQAMRSLKLVGTEVLPRLRHIHTKVKAHENVG